MSGYRTIKIQCIDERGAPSHAVSKFPAHTLARFSRKGADEQGSKVKNPSATFDIHVDCSVDMFTMIITWMRRNEKEEDIGRWSHIETPRHNLTIRQKAKLYELAIYHFKVVRGAEHVREGLITAIDNKRDAFTQADVEYLKEVLAQDSNLLVKIDQAVAKHFVLGWMHDDEVTKMQAWTGSRKEDTKMFFMVGEYIKVLKNAEQEGRIRRDRWQDEFPYSKLTSRPSNFPRINAGQPQAAPTSETVVVAPPRNPWVNPAGGAAVLFGVKVASSLSKDSSIGDALKTNSPPNLTQTRDDAPPSSPATMEPALPKKIMSPQSEPSSPAKITLPTSKGTTSDEAATEPSTYLGSDDSLSTQAQATQIQDIQAWQAAQYEALRFQTTPNRPMTTSEWRIFTSENISIAKLEHVFAHGAIHQLDFDRVYNLYDDLIQAELWATIYYVHPSSHVPIGQMYNHFYGGSAWFSHGADDGMIFSAKRVVLDGFLRSVGGVGFPLSNLDFEMEPWGSVVLTMVDGMKMEQRAQALTWRIARRVRSFCV